MPQKKIPAKPHPLHGSAPHPQLVSGRWILSAIGISIGAAALCIWVALVLLFWQGSWQLLYHPKSAVTRTPASIGCPFDSVAFDTGDSGVPQLHGWWIAGAFQPRYTALYLHGADGNLGDAVDAFIPLHRAGLNVFAFDYRGYGMSRFQHPSEARWREDAEAALSYLTETRHIPVTNIILAGNGLGGDLALEFAAAHPGLAGVVVDNPLPDPASLIFNDPRAHLVPAHLLVSDRWNLPEAASSLRIPSLWFRSSAAKGDSLANLDAYQKVTARKVQVWLTNPSATDRNFNIALGNWLDNLSGANHEQPPRAPEPSK